MKNPIHYFSAFILILFTSCATIFTGTKAKIKLTSNVSGIEAKVNGKPLKINEKTGKIAFSKKIKSPVLEISRPGYETQKFNLVRNKLGWGTADALNMTFGSMCIGAGVLFGSGLFNGENVDQNGNSTPIDNTGLAMPLYAAGGLMVVSAIVDYASGAIHNVPHKELDFDMIPTPGRVKTESMEVISCNSLSFKIKTGSEIGSVYTSRGKTFNLVKNYKWDESSNIEIEELKVQVNTEFEGLGYPVPGMKSNFKQENRVTRFLINAEVIDFKYNEYSTLVTGWSSITSALDQNCTLKVRWTVYDSQKDTVVYEKETSSKVWGNNQSLKLLALQSLSGNLKKLVYDEAWEKLLRRQ